MQSRVNKTGKKDTININENVDKNQILPSLESQSEHTNIKAFANLKSNLNEPLFYKDGYEGVPNNDNVVEDPLDELSYLPDGLSVSCSDKSIMNGKCEIILQTIL